MDLRRFGGLSDRNWCLVIGASLALNVLLCFALGKEMLALVSFVAAIPLLSYPLLEGERR